MILWWGVRTLMAGSIPVAQIDTAARALVPWNIALTSFFSDLVYALWKRLYSLPPGAECGFVVIVGVVTSRGSPKHRKETSF